MCRTVCNYFGGKHSDLRRRTRREKYVVSSRYGVHGFVIISQAVCSRRGWAVQTHMERK